MLFISHPQWVDILDGECLIWLFHFFVLPISLLKVRVVRPYLLFFLPVSPLQLRLFPFLLPSPLLYLLVQSLLHLPPFPLHLSLLAQVELLRQQTPHIASILLLMLLSVHHFLLLLLIYYVLSDHYDCQWTMIMSGLLIIMQRQNEKPLNMLYNQDVAIEDAQQTAFYYHKTLAFEFLMALFTFLSILVAFVEYSSPGQLISTDKSHIALSLLTFLTIIALVLEKLSLIKWITAKKDWERNPAHQYGYMLLEITLLMFFPNAIYSGGTVQVSGIKGDTIVLNLNDLLTTCLLCRSIYFLKFFIHSELYYGSRPDRLSRLYAVRFGTFNAFKFLINEKPHSIIICIFVMNYLFLPFLLLSIEGRVNQSLQDLLSCLYFSLVTQMTIGYGEILVVTKIGRFICTLSILIGITTTSLILLFFMRLMTKDRAENDSYALLQFFQDKKGILQSRVRRIEMEQLFKIKKRTEEEKEKEEETLISYREWDRQLKKRQKGELTDVKKIMHRNFVELNQLIEDFKETEYILAKYIKIFEKENIDGSH